MFKTIIIIIIVGVLVLLPFNVSAGSMEIRQKILDVAQGEFGDTYLLTKAGPDSFDCSGLVNYSYIKAGVSGFKLMDNTHGPDTDILWTTMTDPVDEPLKGDLVFLDFTADRSLPRDGVNDPHSHVGIYMGGDQTIHASPIVQPGQKGVRYALLSNWKSLETAHPITGEKVKQYAGARRIKAQYWPNNDNGYTSDVATQKKEEAQTAKTQPQPQQTKPSLFQYLLNPITDILTIDPKKEEGHPVINNELQPNSGAPGIKVMIKGKNFKPDQSLVLNLTRVHFTNGFNRGLADIASISDTEIVVIVPDGKGKAEVTVENARGTSNIASFIYKSPKIDNISPPVGGPGVPVVITGENFGDKLNFGPQGVKFGETLFASVDAISWEDNKIVVLAPSDYGMGTAKQTLGGVLGCVTIAGVAVTYPLLLANPVGKLVLEKTCNYMLDGFYNQYMLKIKPDFTERTVNVTVKTASGDSNTDKTFTYKVPTQSFLKEIFDSFTTVLEPAIVNTPYLAPLQATGGKPPYTWQLDQNSSSLPPGLSINNKNGTIEGTPTKAGTYNFVVEAKDSSGGFLGGLFRAGQKTTQILTLVVNEAEKQTPTPAPPANPTNLLQIKPDGKTAIGIGGTTNEQTVVVKAKVTDPDNDKVKLQLELRRIDEIDEYEGKFDETKGGLKETDFVKSGAEAEITVYGLVNGNYHWRARAIDEKDSKSDWVNFGNNSLFDVDFAVYKETTPLPDPSTKLEITTASLIPSTATVSTPYSSDPIIATGGKLPYKWWLLESSAPLPQGLSINRNTGVITGTPTRAGTYNFVVAVEDSYISGGIVGVNEVDTQSFTLTVNEEKPIEGQRPTITTETLEPATVNTPYSALLNATGGKAPYEWSLYSNNSPLPPGLKINRKSGVIEGTPTKAGTYNFVVEVKDNSGGFLGGLLGTDQKTTQSFTLVVNEAPKPTPTRCITTGCGNMLCKPENELVSSTVCDPKPESQCYVQFGICERQSDGVCGWTFQPAFPKCVEDSNKPPSTNQVDISIDGNLTITRGQTGTKSITANISEWENKSASFKVNGLSSGASGTFSPSSCDKFCNTTLTITTNPATPLGTYEIFITATRESKNDNARFTLTIAPEAKQDTPFLLSNNGDIVATQGETVSQTITAKIPQGNTKPLSFLAKGVPDPAFYYFDPPACTASCMTTLRIQLVNPEISIGSSNIVVGVADSYSETTTFTLKLNKKLPSSTPIVQLTPISSSQIKLSWSDTAAQDDGLQIERKIESGNDYTFIHGEQKRNLSSYVDSSGLKPNMKYCYQIYFTNLYVSSPRSKEQCATTLKDTSIIPQEKPDLVITSLRAPLEGRTSKGSTDIYSGGILQNVSITIANLGSVSAGQFRVEFYWSSDPTITVDDIPAKSYFLPSGLGPGESKTSSELGISNQQVNVPSSLSPNKYYLGAIIDDSKGNDTFPYKPLIVEGGQVEESNETNNARVADTGPIILSGPPQPPRLISPKKEAVFNYEPPYNQTYQWEKVEQAESYKVQVFKGSNCRERWEGDTNTSNNQITSDLPFVQHADQIFSWQVFTLANGVSSAPSECWSFTVLQESAPSAPTNLVVQLGSSNPWYNPKEPQKYLSQVLTLTWTDNSNELIFLISKKEGNANWRDNFVQLSSNITTFSDDSVSPGVSYCYRVRAKGTAGASLYSLYSNEACFP